MEVNSWCNTNTCLYPACYLIARFCFKLTVYTEEIVECIVILGTYCVTNCFQYWINTSRCTEEMALAPYLVFLNFYYQLASKKEH